MKKEENAENHSFLFEDMTTSELKNTIIKRWKEVESLEAEKKDYVAGIRDTVKELKEQIRSLVYWVGVKETEEAKAQLIKDVGKALE